MAKEKPLLNRPLVGKPRLVVLDHLFAVGEMGTSLSASTPNKVIY